MRFSADQKALHQFHIALWFAKRRKSSIRKVLLDLTITSPNTDNPGDVLYYVYGKRTYAFVVAGVGDIYRPLPKPWTGQTHEVIGNIFDGTAWEDTSRSDV